MTNSALRAGGLAVPAQGRGEVQTVRISPSSTARTGFHELSRGGSLLESQPEAFQRDRESKAYFPRSVQCVPVIATQLHRTRCYYGEANVLTAQAIRNTPCKPHQHQM